jgi:uncharacterized membrane protein
VRRARSDGVARSPEAGHDDKDNRIAIRLFGRPAFGGLVLAVLFWIPALTPTLIPRAPMTQAVVNAVVLAIAYGLGSLIGLGVRVLWKRRSRHFPAVTRRVAWVTLGIGWLIGLAVGMPLWLAWQNDQRAVMGMAALDGVDALLMVVLSIVIGVVLVVVGRLIGSAVVGVVRLSRRVMPSLPAAVPVGLAVFVVLLGFVGWAAWEGVTALAESTHRAQNAGTDEGTLQPESPSVSGSAESLVAWDTLGRQGRNFVSGATSLEQLRQFHEPNAALIEPVRVYVGVESARSVPERAELAVRELERAGGFDRDVLAVWVPTGTGWTIPEAAEALEQLHGGDTAVVAVQYSVLPSLLAVLMEPGREVETGLALFDAVHARWLDLPADRRPRIVLFGKSLGTAGVEAPFAGVDAAESVANLISDTDGALIVGAKLSNPIHAQVTRERDQDSPVWEPVFDGGRSVRFLNRDPAQAAMSSPWPAPRIVYLQHPSDPVPFWGVDALWKPPEWLDQPRGFDVPSAAGWYPIASAAHAVADMIFQLDTPPGFGHVYSTEYVKGWTSVIPPDGWTEADTARLDAFVYRDPPTPEQH